MSGSLTKNDPSIKQATRLPRGKSTASVSWAATPPKQHRHSKTFLWTRRRRSFYTSASPRSATPICREAAQPQIYSSENVNTSAQNSTTPREVPGRSMPPIRAGSRSVCDVRHRVGNPSDQHASSRRPLSKAAVNTVANIADARAVVFLMPRGAETGDYTHCLLQPSPSIEDGKIGQRDNNAPNAQAWTAAPRADCERRLESARDRQRLPSTCARATAKSPVKWPRTMTGLSVEDIRERFIDVLPGAHKVSPVPAQERELR